MVDQISCCVGDLKIEIHVTFKEPLEDVKYLVMSKDQKHCKASLIYIHKQEHRIYHLFYISVKCLEQTDNFTSIVL